MPDYARLFPQYYLNKELFLSFLAFELYEHSGEYYIEVDC
jgi:hypothetical protein